MAMSPKPRERIQLRLSVPASPPPPFFPHKEQHPFGALPSTPPGSPGPAVTCLTELEMLPVVVLGRGAGGTVYAARHRRTGAALAVKEVRDAGAALREAGVHLRVPDHPCVVRLHGVCVGHPGAGNQFVYLVLERLAGGSLGDVLLRRGPLPEAAIASVARHVLRGLRHLHRLGVAHGDVKSSNLLVGDHGEIKIADFGASRLVGETRHDQSSYQSATGTCAYMSPEKLHPEEWFSAATSPGVEFSGDVWSLGVVLLECHAGRFPLVAAGERADWPALVLAVCFAAAPPELPVAASPEFGGFVQRCLEKDWRRRATVEELLGHPFVAGKPSWCGANNEWLATFHDKTGQVNKSICGEDGIEV